MDLVSVIIPAYKSKFLRDSIHSVLNQTYQNLEIVIVNDASPENIQEIVSGINDKRIKYFENKENIGGKDLVANWNHCLDLSSGSYFVLFSDDDLLAPTFVERMMEIANKNPEYSVFKCRTKIIDEHAHLVTMSATGPEKESYLDFIWHQIMSYRSHTASEFLYKTETIRRMGGFVSFPVAYYSDYASICKFIKGSFLISTTEALVSFRMSGDNLSSCNRKNMEKTEALFMYIKWMTDYLESIQEKGCEEMVMLVRKALKSRMNRDYYNYISNASIIEIFKIYRWSPRNVRSVKILVKALVASARMLIYKEIHV